MGNDAVPAGKTIISSFNKVKIAYSANDIRREPGFKIDIKLIANLNEFESVSISLQLPTHLTQSNKFAITHQMSVKKIFDSPFL
jgi:hypothetical protein